MNRFVAFARYYVAHAAAFTGLAATIVFVAQGNLPAAVSTGLAALSAFGLPIKPADQPPPPPPTLPFKAA
jgi:hypothetical protein